MVEQQTFNLWVLGSIPNGITHTQQFLLHEDSMQFVIYVSSGKVLVTTPEKEEKMRDVWFNQYDLDETLFSRREVNDDGFYIKPVCQISW
jgi:hypothetical protein